MQRWNRLLEKEAAYKISWLKNTTMNFIPEADYIEILASSEDKCSIL